MGSMNDSARLLGGALLGGMMSALLVTPAAAQTQTVSTDDYARAERLVGYNANPLVDHLVPAVTWLDDTHFWYRDQDATGNHFLQMDASSGKSSPSFDAGKLAAALAAASGKLVDATKLPLSDYRLRDDGGFELTVAGKHYRCDPLFKACVVAVAKGGKEPGVLSPDKRSEAFIREWNLWLRDIASGKETQLTHDGATDYGYATDNAGWIHSDRAILVWSPDSSSTCRRARCQRARCQRA
jgi:hypothetical protein